MVGEKPNERGSARAAIEAAQAHWSDRSEEEAVRMGVVRIV